MNTTLVFVFFVFGNTTFIQNFLRDSREKAVVLVNDFGRTGIDGEIFSSGGIESIELPSGCVCCTLKTDLITTIEKIIKDFAPDHLIIEPSVISSPSGVLEVLDLLSITAVTVIGIVDSTEFVDLYKAGIYGSFFQDQVAHSDVVLINKSDLVDEDKITETLALIGQLNPDAITFRTVQAKLEETIPALMTGPRSIQRHSSHLHFDTESFRMARTVGFSVYERLFEDMKEGIYGNIVRAKSLVVTDRGPFRFDLAYGAIDAVPLAFRPGNSRLVVIGEHIEKKAIRQVIMQN